MVKASRVYRAGTFRNAYLKGFERGYNIATWCDIPELGSIIRTDSDGKQTVTSDNVADIMYALCYEIEFSPFEVTAHTFNTSRNTDAGWEAFDAGISDGIKSNLKDRNPKEIA